MNEITMIPIERLHAHPDNPRKELGDLTELADSIRANGILQNLTIIPGHRATDEELEQIVALYDSLDDSNEMEANAKTEIREQIENRWAANDYTVIIGHRRMAASKLAGLTELPCTIVQMTPKEQVQTMLLENIQRSDLTVYEQAQGFQMMLDLGATVEEISEKSGFSETTVRRRVKMMELDQTILKQVSGRQLSLGDFDTLAQIEDISDRNECLANIGTRDFELSVKRALNQQRIKRNLPAVKSWLKERKAKKITASESWSNKYEGVGSWIYISNWGEKGNEPPKSLPAELFYTLDDSSLRLFRKTERAKPQKKPPEEIAKEKAIAESWKALEETGKLALSLRRSFVEQLSVTSKNRPDVLYGALLAMVLNSIDYRSPDRNAIASVFGIEPGYNPNRGQELAANLNAVTNKTLAGLVYAGFDDDEIDSVKDLCVELNYRKEFPKYKRSAKWSLLYEWLNRLGYEPSTEEASVLDGTHEAFLAREKYENQKEEPS